MASSSSDWPVHQLWPPSGGKQRTKLDIVLFHGLQLTASNVNDAWISTWTQRGDDNVCWPKEWLPFDLGEAVRIFSLSYDVHVVTSPHDHVSEIAHNLFQNLMDRRYEWRRPIVLIGHSFGGLVLKSFVVKLERESTIRSHSNAFSKAAARRAKEFLSNVRGVAFYAVPHAGSTNIPTYVNKLLRCKNRHHCGIMGNMKPCRRDMNQLSVDFDCIVTENQINILAFCEGRSMEQVGILVDFTSAQQSARDNCYKVEDANHMEVCKPPSKEHPSYGLLLQLVNTCQEVGEECEQALQEVHDLPQSTFGLESYVERVEALVMSAGSGVAPRYVGIWGMGGVGKTLLLKTMYASPKIYRHFQKAKFIWLTVGQTPDVMLLYRRLSEELGLKLQSNVTAEDYKLKLHSQFRCKRIFLVLDDVWEVKTFDALDLAKGEGSVTLMSTRNAFLLDRATPHISQEHIIPLSEENSWNLFCVHAFKVPSNIPHELKGLAHSMVQQCQGLPLALKVIGRAMCGKFSPERQWEPLLKKLRESRMQERTVQDELYERLKLGYDLLLEDDSRLTRCFLYFTAFPEDCTIMFDDIVCGWMGEGLVPANGEDDPRADAYDLLTMLWKRSFIESNIDVENDDYDDQYLWFKVHDVMRDLGFYILKKDCGLPPAEQLYINRAGRNLEKVPEECTTIAEAFRLSMSWNNLKTIPGSFCAPVLVSLLLQNNPILSLPATCWINFPKLKVLNLSYAKFDSLPDEVCNLTHLVSLNCSNTYLRSFPSSIGKLQTLKWLNLSDTLLNYLPPEVSALTSLQVLLLRGCSNLIWSEQIKPVIALAEFLGLEYPTVTASLEDISQLHCLTRLEISGLCTVDVELPHSISFLTKLELLRLFIKLKTFPPEMPFWFKQLRTLSLWGGTNMKYFPTSLTHRDAFPALVNFNVLSPWLVQFPDMHEESLPKLRNLSLHCESLSTNFICNNNSNPRIIIMEKEVEIDAEGKYCSPLIDFEN